jgi:hypothetical protein
MFLVSDFMGQHTIVRSNLDATLKVNAEDTVSDNEETPKETKLPPSDENPHRYCEKVKAPQQFQKPKSLSSAK